VLLQQYSESGYFIFMLVTTFASTTVKRLRVANVWVVTAGEKCYCSNILTLANLGLCLLTNLLAQQCGVLEWPRFGWLLRAE
jgi:hypothetical protein